MLWKLFLRISVLSSLSFAIISPAISLAIDFSLDGKDDFLVKTADGISVAITQTGEKVSVPCGQTSDIALAGRLGPFGKPRFAFWRPGQEYSGISQSSFFICLLGANPIQYPFGHPHDIPFAASDFDGDGIDDLTTWTPKSGQWQISRSSLGFHSEQFGLPGDAPAPCDYDGDAKSDLGLFRPATGEWIIKRSSNNSIVTQPWGLPSDIPLPADYDGDGMCDIAVYRPETSAFYVIPSATSGGVIISSFNTTSRLPLHGDVNGDGAEDFGIITNAGEVLFKTSAQQSGPTVLNPLLNKPTAVNLTRRYSAVRNDFDGDGSSDLGVIRELSPGLLYWLLATPSGAASGIEQWGLTGDRLVPSDYDGDKKSDLAVVRAISGFMHWLIRQSSDGQTRDEIFGTALDAPVSGDYDADAKSDIAVVRLASGGGIEWYVKSTLFQQTLTFSWGLVGDHVATGSFIEPGITDAAVIRPALGGLTWFVRDLEGTALPPVSWGLVGDQPAPADYDGDGRTDFAVVREVNGLLVLFVRTAAGPLLPPHTWGLPGDTVLPGKYGVSLRDEPAVWREDAQSFYAISDSQLGNQLIPWGLKGDRIIPTLELYSSSPAAPTPQPPGGNSDTEFSCTKTLSPTDGSGGFVHKPISESDGKLVVILPSKYAGQTNRLEIGSQGKILERGRFAGNNNGNRPHFRFSKPGGSYPNFMVEIAYLSNGDRICYTIPNPSKRYD